MPPSYCLYDEVGVHDHFARGVFCSRHRLPRAVVGEPACTAQRSRLGRRKVICSLNIDSGLIGDAYINGWLHVRRISNVDAQDRRPVNSAVFGKMVTATDATEPGRAQYPEFGPRERVDKSWSRAQHAAAERAVQRLDQTL